MGWQLNEILPREVLRLQPEIEGEGAAGCPDTMEGQEGAPGVEAPPTADAPPAADADVPGHRRSIDPSQKRRLWKYFDENFMGWRTSNLPREGVDEKLDKFITEIELVRTQVSRQLTTWKKAKNLNRRTDCSIVYSRSYYVPGVKR